MGKIDLTGQRFGRLVVIECAGRNERGKTMWKCACDCGNVVSVRVDGLTSGHTSSCGCLKKEKSGERVKMMNTKHGEAKTRLYRIWVKMRERCSYQALPNYSDYGGRGIKVCDEWVNNFAAFRDWALANGYNDNLSIDRIDVNGNYCPENCKWATPAEQSDNRRNTIVLSYGGETHTLTEWAEITGIKRKTLWERIKNGWSVERAFTEPIKENKRRAEKI